MDSFSVVNLLVPLLVALAVAGRGFTVDADYISRWASSAGIQLTARNRPVVQRYLEWSRRSRTAGGLAGFFAPVVYSVLTVGSTPSDGVWSLLLMFVGYLVGAIFAEAVVNSVPRSHSPSDSRRLEDYLPVYVPILQRCLGVASLAFVLVYAIAGPIADADPIVSVVEVTGWGIGGACIAALVEALQRRIVARRRAIDVGGREIDDAMKSSSLHVVAGAGLGLLLNIVGGGVMVLSGLTGSPGPRGIFGWSLFAVGGFMLISSIVLWLAFGKPHGFRVRRQENEPAV